MITDEKRARLYPQEDQVGEEGPFHLPLDDDRMLDVDGVFLGVATARQNKHNHAGDFAPHGRRCPACRWFEPRIFRELTGKQRYVMYTLGCSNLPTETDRPRYRYAADADEAIFVMSTMSDDGSTRFLSAPAQRMFDMAAEYDLNIQRALKSQWTINEADDSARWQT